MTDEAAPRLDPAVVASLFVEHGGALRRFLRGVLRGDDLASEALQATFTKAIERGHTVQPDALKAWLYRVAYHEAMNLRRRQQRDLRAREQVAARHASPAVELPQAADDETLGHVRAQLLRLPPEQRVVVERRIYQGETFAAIANSLGIPLGTVQTRMRLALDKLRKALEAP